MADRYSVASCRAIIETGRFVLLPDISDVRSYTYSIVVESAWSVSFVAVGSSHWKVGIEIRWVLECGDVLYILLRVGDLMFVRRCLGFIGLCVGVVRISEEVQ